MNGFTLIQRAFNSNRRDESMVFLERKSGNACYCIKERIRDVVA